MNCYLDMEQPTSSALNREESISDTARRRAVSMVLSDEDDSSGIFENKVPLRASVASLRSIDSHDGKLVGRKSKSLGSGHDHTVTLTTVTSFEEKLLRDVHLAVGIEVMEGGAAQDHLKESEVSVTKKDLELVESPPAFRRKLAQHRSSQLHQPGAFREGGNGEISAIGLPRSPSEGTLFTTFETPPLREVLVDAELVSLSDRYPEASSVPEYHKSILVEASLVDESEQLPNASFVNVIKTNRKVQIGICSIVIVLLAMSLAISLALTLGPRASICASKLFTAPTLSPTTTTQGILMQLLESNLPPSSFIHFDNMQSSQYKAMQWLQEDVNLTSYSEERMLQRFALAQLFYSTGGATQWTESNGWLSGSHECSWFTSSSDASCKNGIFVRLSLFRNGLGGSIPVELGLLRNLVEIELQTQYMVGTIPGELMSQLTSLECLSISSNLISGTMPTEIGLLTNLTNILLHANGLEGTLPTELGLLTNVVHMQLFHQFLEGTIPTEIGHLTNLKTLGLWMNRFSGAVPSEIGHLTNLAELSIHDNAFSGIIPSEMGNLVEPEMFELQRNNFTGPIPSELGNLNIISYFNVGDNTLTGSIPTEVLRATNLFFFSIYSNQVSGKIPTEFGELSIMEELYLDANHLSGTLPTELGRMQMLTDFWANDNDLSGAVPEELCEIQSGTLIQLDCMVGMNCSCLGFEHSIDEDDA
jgi:Leucine-rich repeat (LRR) protein